MHPAAVVCLVQVNELQCPCTTHMLIAAGASWGAGRRLPALAHPLRLGGWAGPQPLHADHRLSRRLQPRRGAGLCTMMIITYTAMCSCSSEGAKFGPPVREMLSATD